MGQGSKSCSLQPIIVTHQISYHSPQISELLATGATNVYTTVVCMWEVERQIHEPMPQSTHSTWAQRPQRTGRPQRRWLCRLPAGHPAGTLTVIPEKEINSNQAAKMSYRGRGGAGPVYPGFIVLHRIIDFGTDAEHCKYLGAVASFIHTPNRPNCSHPHTHSTLTTSLTRRKKKKTCPEEEKDTDAVGSNQVQTPVLAGRQPKPDDGKRKRHLTDGPGDVAQHRGEVSVLCPQRKVEETPQEQNDIRKRNTFWEQPSAWNSQIAADF